MPSQHRLRDKRINFWLTESELMDIKKRADSYDMSVSEFLRMLALNTDIKLDLSKINTTSSLNKEDLTLGVELPLDKQAYNSLSENSKKAGLEAGEFLKLNALAGADILIHLKGLI